MAVVASLNESEKKEDYEKLKLNYVIINRRQQI